MWIRPLSIGSCGYGERRRELADSYCATLLKQQRRQRGDGGSPDGARAYSVRASTSPVAQIDHAVAEAALIQQFEIEADVAGEGLFAASHHDRRNEQVAFVH